MGNPGCLLFIFTRANWLVHGLGKEQNWAIALNIRTPPPPAEDLPFLLTPEDWLKLHSPLKTSIKYGLTFEEYGFTLKIFVKITPPKNSIFLYSTLKEILNSYNLPLENSMVPQPKGGGGGGLILNAIAHSGLVRKFRPGIASRLLFVVFVSQFHSPQ